MTRAMVVQAPLRQRPRSGRMRGVQSAVTPEQAGPFRLTGFAALQVLYGAAVIGLFTLTVVSGVLSS